MSHTADMIESLAHPENICLNSHSDGTHSLIILSEVLTTSCRENDQYLAYESEWEMRLVENILKDSAGDIH
ncbi:hypothetical protein Q8A67_017648 [Cirrhinus molitorella]|uniref:Uncharacterized protein n=1 Tax=Cirrhinus molitorella TaxID=172907 RepID=A0AA88PEI4_9TELE|nr:hypothetical protein Q8A67_017648 [Cirrhinus molitorella]